MNNEALDPTIAFLRGKFGEYYKRKEPEWPPRFGTREWAFFLWDGKGMFRHTAFLSPAKLRNFLESNGPRHVYYSSAYYQKPAAPTMGQKGWLGADLIFDIDADHIKGAEKMTYHQMLDKVKEEIIKLVDEFLLKDFAFDKNYLQVVFSGGRGYHVHVHDPRVLELDSHERKEIVDYIMSTDLDMDLLYRKEVVSVDGPKDHPNKHYRYILPDSHEAGWRGRFPVSINKYVTKLEKMERADAIKELEEAKGIGKKMANELYSKLFDKRLNGPRGVDTLRERNIVEIFPTDNARNAFTKLVLDKTKVQAGEADAPVTKDINRLIRLPGSLHGKSSLRVVPLSMEELYKFEPLVDAIAFGDEPLNIVVKRGLKFDIKGQDYDLKTGDATLPEHAAIFLMSRGEATLKVG